MCTHAHTNPTRARTCRDSHADAEIYTAYRHKRHMPTSNHANRAHRSQAHAELKDTHMQTLVRTAVVCTEMVNDKQWFVFPCWHCNVLLSPCIPPLSPPLPFSSSPVFPILSCAQLCPSPSSPHPPCLPVVLFHQPSLCLTSTHPHLSLCLVLFSPHAPPPSLCEPATE